MVVSRVQCIPPGVVHERCVWLRPGMVDAVLWRRSRRGRRVEYERSDMFSAVGKAEYVYSGRRVLFWWLRHRRSVMFLRSARQVTVRVDLARLPP